MLDLSTTDLIKMPNTRHTNYECKLHNTAAIDSKWQTNIHHVLKKRFLFLLHVLCVLALTHSSMHAQRVFTSFDELWAYTNENSTTIKSGAIKLDQAQRAKLAAIASIADLNGNATLQVTNNTKLPVSIFPAEAFGGTPGTYQEIQTGVPYVNNLNQYAEVKLVNLTGWQNFKLAKINTNITAVENTISQKNLYENIAATYYNIASLQQQLLLAKKNVAIADTLAQLVKNKYEEGFARFQETNTAQINLLNAQETVVQLEYVIQQQYIALKILCDIPDTDKIEIQQQLNPNTNGGQVNVLPNTINMRNNQLREMYALTFYQQQKRSLFPTLSAFASNSNQQFSNNFSLFDQQVRWINSNYIGLKANWFIPSANTISQISKSKYDFLLAKQNTTHAILQDDFESQQLQIELAKTNAQMYRYQQIMLLQKDNYRRDLENYQKGILPLDQLLTSYTTMVNGEYNYNASIASVMLAQQKIKINNLIQ